MSQSHAWFFIFFRRIGHDLDLISADDVTAFCCGDKCLSSESGLKLGIYSHLRSLNNLGGLWNVFKGVMLLIFVLDFTLMVANAGFAAWLLLA